MNQAEKINDVKYKRLGLKIQVDEDRVNRKIRRMPCGAAQRR